VTFADEGGKTKLTLEQTHAAGRARLAQPGLERNLERLADLLERR